ncbi:Asp23/Gls24 family envelope stress response protein [Corynebacterium pelargi]|uniref:Uncharacterized protein n=1 Tax=Corynebacterium pelargi TaxID=1471400 RepID=A0A410WB37_9CORY|nr:Asp23/Gls24 family envelope stress response protein [Corynebacterium pelargi]QAU53165.1 hypothetical protein CPELA_09550 [Corynebacterium pelargi]GGG74424.1 hypothetical protein GCM10007338_09710 [Corynebacterium pelargi]
MATLSLDKAQALVEAVVAIPGVHAMHSGRFGEVALLYPKQRVQGLRFQNRDEESFEVDIVAEFGADNLYDLAEEVRATAAQTLKADGLTMPVSVVIADIATEQQAEEHE